MEKKLLFITNIAGDKGVDSFSMASISAAHAIGYKFHVAANYARVTTEQKKKDENQYDVTIHHVDFHRNPLHLGNIKAYQQVCDLIEKEQITCIHCNTPIGGLIGRLAGRKCGVKRIIYQAHGFHFYKGAPLLNWLLYYPVERLLARCTDILITINHEDYEIAQKKFHLRNQGKVYYVPGVGIDLKAYEQVTAGSLRADVRQELGLDENATVCISMGDLIPRKNYSVAIEAMGRLCKKHPELHYLICGRGPELDNLKRLAVKNDIEGNVHFLGFRNDIKTLLQVSDFFLFASLQEGLPRSTMEAMASGLPLVCSRIRGNIDLIVEGQGGFMFEPKNVDDCVRAINGLLTSDHKKMGEYNLTRVREFSLEEAGERLTAIYQDEFYGNEGGGTDLSEYYPAWYKKRLEFGFCASDTVVIAVGRLDRNKNHKTILQAVEKIKDPSIQLVLCGDGEERSVLEKQVKKLDIEKQVHFLGNRSDMKELYAMSDVFVLASYREGLSRSIMEAMICGLPCIVSDIRGNRDLIEDGIGGYLVGPDDALGMAKRIEELTVDRNRRRIMGTVNYQKIRRFDVGKVIKILQKIYEEVF